MKHICAVLVTLLAVCANTAAFAEDPVSMISQYRRSHGLPAVHADAALNVVAKQQANAMAARGVLSHDVGGSFASRVSHADVGRAGENIAMGQTNWSGAMQAWKASSGHNRNLLMPGATRVGVAVSYGGGSRPRAYWAMVIAGGAETRTVRGPNGKVIRTSMRGAPFMMAMPQRGRRAAVANDYFTRKGEITPNQ